MIASRPIVYLGPSMPLPDARRILQNADYRRPIRRGDLQGLEPGTVAAIIDGVFEQSLAVSPREVHEALSRGVVLYGGGSMGALRAAEVEGVVGVGRIFEWYRDEILTRDDEVALLFDEDSGRPLTVPTVNIRFAADRLRSLGTIDAATAQALISAALSLPYTERTYRAVLDAAGLLKRADAEDLIGMLRAHDLKYRDAQAVLEAVDFHLQRSDSRNGSSARQDASGVAGPVRLDGPQAGNDILIWESGDSVPQRDLFEFLAFTGKLANYAGSLASWLEPQQEWSDEDRPPTQRIFEDTVRGWGWVSSEEARVTLSDLQLPLDAVNEDCEHEATLAGRARALLSERSDVFQQALLARLFRDDLALKRETMRLGALRSLAARRGERPSAPEISEARTVLCKLNGQFSFGDVRQQWSRLGYSDEAAHDAFVALVASARAASREMDSPRAEVEHGGSSADALRAFGFESRPKLLSDSRFSVPAAEAEAHARRIADAIGITRIGFIGELSHLGGIHVAQAARPGNSWSSSYGSGKSRTRNGALTGSVMEELEKWAQEKFLADASPDCVVGTFDEWKTSREVVDPATLDLPYDSVYRPDLSLEWLPCQDLLSGREVLAPVDGLQITHRKHDIYYTARGARKHLATNGLGAGFTREEAVLHALCEVVERHAQRLAELLLSNPGGLGEHPYRFVDLQTASAAVQDVATRLSKPDSVVRVLDITSEIGIPTAMATITRERQRADGYGAHPDPDTAIEMALLEAAQTIASAVAGGREDLSVQARSLGRHERPRPASVRDAWFWMDPDADYKPVSGMGGLRSDDLLEDLAWSLKRVREAGFKHVLAVDLTQTDVAPAAVVRVVVPGMETNNPFYTGPRARRLLIRDMLPKRR